MSQIQDQLNSSIWAEFYINSNFGGTYSYYLGPCYRASDVITDAVFDGVDSVKTNGWLIMYDQENYQGNYLTLHNDKIEDLNKLPHYGGGDWKGKIQSFVLYNEEPPNWGSSGRPEQTLQGCSCVLWSDADLSGDNTICQGPMAIGSMIGAPFFSNPVRSLYHNIESIQPGPQWYAMFFDQPNFLGNSLNGTSGHPMNDLNQIPRGDSGDWKNQIQSFWQTDAPPPCWNLRFDAGAFKAAFPDNYGDRTASNCFDYMSQDAEYRIKTPVWQYPDWNTVVVTINIDCIVSSGSDDHLAMTVSMDGTGKLLGISSSGQTGSGYQIPQGVIKGVDDTVELAGAVGALETCGISEEAAEEFTEVFDAVCKTYNYLSGVMYKISTDNDGAFYLNPVGCHAVNRLLAAVSFTTQPAAPLHISFNQESFFGVLSDTPGITGVSPQSSGNNSMLCTYAQYSSGGNTYHTWHPEISVMKNDVGMLLSCKIDLVHNNAEDDHIIMLAGFSRAPGPDGHYTIALQFVQATVQFAKNSSANIAGTPLRTDKDTNVTSTDLPQMLQNSLQTAINAAGYASNTPQYGMAAVAALNLQAMAASVAP